MCVFVKPICDMKEVASECYMFPFQTFFTEFISCQETSVIFKLEFKCRLMYAKENL